MGATSLRATFRVTWILARMTKEEASALGVVSDPWRYTRISGSKENYAPPPDKATWFKLESIELGNGTADYPAGDNLQVTATWEPNKLMDGIKGPQLKEVFDLIRAGTGIAGVLFSPSMKSENWVGNVIGKVTGKAPEHSSRIVKTWTENKVLIQKEYRSPAAKKDVQGLTLNEVAVAAMVSPGGW